MDKYLGSVSDRVRLAGIAWYTDSFTVHECGEVRRLTFTTTSLQEAIEKIDKYRDVLQRASGESYIHTSSAKGTASHQ